MNEKFYYAKDLAAKEKVSGDLSPEVLPTGLAKVFYESKIFKDIQSEAQAIVKILAGREMGLSPLQSMSSVFIVDNKVGYETKIFLSKLKKSKKYDYSVKFQEENGNFSGCSVSFYCKDKDACLGTSAFTTKDAARIGLINKSTYKNYPQLMLFYRAASNGIKMFCPDILDGAALMEDYVELVPDEKVPAKINLKTLEENLKGEKNKCE